MRKLLIGCRPTNITVTIITMSEKGGITINEGKNRNNNLKENNN